MSFLCLFFLGFIYAANIMHFSFNRNKKLFFEGKKHGKDNEDERDEMVPTEGLRLEDRDHNDGKHDERDGLLNDFQLDEVEWASIDGRSYAVGGNHKRILEQGNAPRHQDYQKQWPVFRRGDNLDQFQLSVPGEGHENVGNDK